MNVCPLGLCRFEEDCPNAPCLDCMKRLGEHILLEVKLMSRQHGIAGTKQDSASRATLGQMIRTMSAEVGARSRMLATL